MTPDLDDLMAAVARDIAIDRVAEMLARTRAAIVYCAPDLPAGEVQVAYIEPAAGARIAFLFGDERWADEFSAALVRRGIEVTRIGPARGAA